MERLLTLKIGHVEWTKTDNCHHLRYSHEEIDKRHMGDEMYKYYFGVICYKLNSDLNVGRA